MGATSVTGKGAGSADGLNKGSEHMTLGAHHIIGPHVLAAGVVELEGTTATIYLPPPPEFLPPYDIDVEGDDPFDLSDDIIIQLSNSSSTHPYVSGFLDTTDGGDWTFEITAGDGDTVWWTLIYPGL